MPLGIHKRLNMLGIPPSRTNFTVGLTIGELGCKADSR
jgi:hypothetical protein